MYMERVVAAGPIRPTWSSKAEREVEGDNYSSESQMDVIWKTTRPSLGREERRRECDFVDKKQLLTRMSADMQQVQRYICQTRKSSLIDPDSCAAQYLQGASEQVNPTRCDKGVFWEDIVEHE